MILEINQVIHMIELKALKHTSISGPMSSRRGLTIPALITKSRSSGPSPAMLPNAQTACSATLL